MSRVLLCPHMEQGAAISPARLARWEWAAVIILVGVCLALAVMGKGRKEREAYERFLGVAPSVQAALERFAADHGGKFPPDAMFTGCPKQLTEKYIKWDRSWKIDYEVRDNGHGGQFVCLEFCGPYKEVLYFGLCDEPEYRKKYGRGQPIPGSLNRIWVIREQAPIMGSPRQ